MKTAELQVEEVLIGALVLGTGLLPWLPELAQWVEAHGNGINLLAGTVVLGAAYLLGIGPERSGDGELVANLAHVPDVPQAGE